MRSSPLGGRHRFHFVLLVAAFGAAGCGGDLGTVSGKVVYNGTVVKGGTIGFFAKGGRHANADIQEDGTYRAENVPVGEVKVIVDNQMLKRALSAPPMASKPPPGMEPPGGYKGGNDPEEAKRRYVPIPLEYADPDKTPLSYTVKPGSQTYDPPLK